MGTVGDAEKPQKFEACQIGAPWDEEKRHAYLKDGRCMNDSARSCCTWIRCATRALVLVKIVA